MTNQIEQVFIFSDTHISKFTGMFNEKIFKMGVKILNEELKSNPKAYLLHLGDISDSGTFEDFVYARDIIQNSFPDKEVYYLSGNHDMRNIGYQLWRDFFGERQFLIDTRDNGGNLVILGIDSSEPDADHGRIGDRGIEAICELATYPDDVIKMLCFHHHLYPIPNTGRERSMILDAGDVAQVIWKAGIDVIVTAHRHYPNIFSLSNGKRRCLLINSGTFSSFKTRGRAGHTFIDLRIKKKNINVSFKGLETYSEFHNNMKVEAQKILNGEIKSSIAYILPGDKHLVKICQISDTHFTNGSDFLPKIYEQGIKMIIREAPSMIIHCGDLTEDSFPESYAIAKMKLRELRKYSIPFVIIPGVRDLQPFGRELFVQQIGPLDPVFEIPALRVIGINTGSDSSGLVGRSRLKMIQRDFEIFGKYKLFMVGMHHACIPIPRSYFKRSVTDAGDVIGFLTSNQVPLVLSGLEHYATTMQIENTVFVNSGTFSSKKIRSKRMNTYNVINVYESGTVYIEEIEIHSGIRHHLGTYRLPMTHEQDV
ncbi:metallophosphoesterase family protein [Candidatus Hodarchaeum mangrovi]